MPPAELATAILLETWIKKIPSAAGKGALRFCHALAKDQRQIPPSHLIIPRRASPILRGYLVYFFEIPRRSPPVDREFQAVLLLNFRACIPVNEGDNDLTTGDAAHGRRSTHNRCYTR
jgi:hypothetical protein